MPLLDIASRVIHILAAVTLGGGLFYLCAVQAPALAETDDATRSRVSDATRRRWARLVMMCSLFLLLSGGYNYMSVIGASKAAEGAELAKFYHPLIGIKMIMALVVMFLASLLSGKSEGAKRMQANPARPLTIASVCVVLIISIAGVLKVAGWKPISKDTNPPAEAAQTADVIPTQS